MEVPILVIGGGALGTAAAWKLAEKYKKQKDTVYLFEKNFFLGEEQSTRNPGVNPAGIYYPPGSLKARLCVLGNAKSKEFFLQYNVPYHSAIGGKLVVAITPDDESMLEFYLKRAQENGVSHVQIIPGDEIPYFEPNVRGRSALLAPTSGIFDAATYMNRLERLAEDAGVTIRKNAKIIGIYPSLSNGFEVWVMEEKEMYYIHTYHLINAAGLYAAKIARMVNPHSPYEIQPIRGEYYTFNKRMRTNLFMFGMNVYTTPRSVMHDGKAYFSVGIHLTPTFEMNEGKAMIGRTVLVGPTADPTDNIRDYGTMTHPPDYFWEAMHPIMPGLMPSDLVWESAGIRAKLKTPQDDFVVECDPMFPGCRHVMADSPGLTSAIPIAEYVCDNLF